MAGLVGVCREMLVFREKQNLAEQLSLARERGNINSAKLLSSLQKDMSLATLFSLGLSDNDKEEITTLSYQEAHEWVELLAKSIGRCRNKNLAVALGTSAPNQIRGAVEHSKLVIESLGHLVDSWLLSGAMTNSVHVHELGVNFDIMLLDEYIPSSMLEGLNKFLLEGHLNGKNDASIWDDEFCQYDGVFSESHLEICILSYLLSKSDIKITFSNFTKLDAVSALHIRVSLPLEISVSPQGNRIEDVYVLYDGDKHQASVEALNYFTDINLISVPSLERFEEMLLSENNKDIINGYFYMRSSRSLRLYQNIVTSSSRHLNIQLILAHGPLLQELTERDEIKYLSVGDFILRNELFSQPFFNKLPDSKLSTFLFNNTFKFRPTILLLEDSKFQASEFIERVSSYADVVHFYNGDAALAYLAADVHVDLLVVDIVLKHKMNGWQFIKLLPVHMKNVPAIAATGYQEADKVLERANFNTVISKPIDYDILKNWVSCLTQGY